MNKTKLLPIVEESLEKYGLSYKVLECPSELSDTAAFCEHFNISLDQAANTILVASRKVDPVKYAVCVVLGTTRLGAEKAGNGTVSCQDEMVDKVIAPGRKPPGEAQDQGTLYERGFKDPERHLWEMIYMDPGAVSPA